MSVAPPTTAPIDRLSPFNNDSCAIASSQIRTICRFHVKSVPYTLRNCVKIRTICASELRYMPSSPLYTIFYHLPSSSYTGSCHSASFTTRCPYPPQHLRHLSYIYSTRLYMETISCCSGMFPSSLLPSFTPRPHHLHHKMLTAFALDHRSYVFHYLAGFKHPSDAFLERLLLPTNSASCTFILSRLFFSLLTICFRISMTSCGPHISYIPSILLSTPCRAHVSLSLSTFVNFRT